MSRNLLAVVVALLPAAAVQAQDGPQKLFETMEQKLTGAKAYKFDFDLEHASDGRTDFKLKGTLVVAAGNKLSLHFMGTADQQAIKGIMVSDGSTLTMKREIDGKPDSRSEPAAAKLCETLTRVLVRAAVDVAVEQTDRSDPKWADQLKVSGFKAAGKAAVEGRETNVVECRVAFSETRGPARCKLWLDAATGLPLKRVLEIDGLRVITENYRNWELDPKLPEGTFLLPK
jgi:outer membrane lipoprotein-sorting protein